MKKIDNTLLQKAVARIVENLDPVAIYLYGSHAYGTPHDDSDIDILIVVEPEDNIPTGCYEKSVLAYSSLRGLKFPAELKVVTRTEFENRSEWISSVERKVREKGKLLYEATKAPKRGRSERVG